MSIFRSSAPDVNEAMKYATDDKVTKTSHMNGMDSQKKTTWINSEYENREALQLLDRRIELENHEMYTGINKGQWPKSVIDALESSGRIKDLPQFNFVIKKIDVIVGSLVQNGYDTEYVSVEGDDNGILQVMKDLYYTDKETCDWATELNTFFKNGAIKSAWLMVNPDYRLNPQFGNIGIRALSPATVFPDPNWISNNSGDMNNAFTVAYMTGHEIKNRYKEHNKRLDTLMRQRALESMSDESINRDALPYFDLHEEYNNTFKVIEYHHMEMEERTTHIGFTDYFQSVRVPENASDEWYELNKVDKDSIMTSKESVNVYYITTIIPDIDLIEPFEDRPGFYQLGRLPLIHWAFNRHNGTNIGAVDLLRDPQQYFNQMLSLTHEMIAHSRRAKIVDWGMFEEDAGGQEELKRKFLDPNEVIFTKPDATNEYPNGIQEAGASQPAFNEQNFSNNILSMSDRLVPGNAAMEGISQGQRESGVKFENTREQGEISMTLIKDSVRNFINELSECYYKAAQGQYGGMYRSFETQKGNKIEINVKLEDGRVWNDISDLPRTKVIVTESPNGVSRRIGDRQIAYEAMTRMQGQLPLIDLKFAEIIYKSMDGISEEDKRDFADISEQQRILLQSGNVAQTSQNEMVTAQAQMQIQQMMQPPQPPPQEGVPAQEGEQPLPQEQQV